MSDNHIVDGYNIEAAQDAFMEHLHAKQGLGTFFKDRTGKKWKYIAKAEGEEKYIASHGEFGIVMTLTDQGDETVRAATELKKQKD